MMLICIYGASGVGKDTFADILEKALNKHHNNFITVKKIKSYTTRPQRYEGEDTHTFISFEEWDSLTDTLIASTEIDGHYYGAGVEQLTADINIYVIDEFGMENVIKSKSIEKISKKIGDVIIVKITRPDDMIDIDEDRKKRELPPAKIDIDQYVNLNIENTGTKKDLEIIADLFSQWLSFFKTIE